MVLPRGFEPRASPLPRQLSVLSVGRLLRGFRCFTGAPACHYLPLSASVCRGRRPFWAFAPNFARTYSAASFQFEMVSTASLKSPGACFAYTRSVMSILLPRIFETLNNDTPRRAICVAAVCRST